MNTEVGLDPSEPLGYFRPAALDRWFIVALSLSLRPLPNEDWGRKIKSRTRKRAIGRRLFFA